MTKTELGQWWELRQQKVNGYHLSENDYRELLRLNQLVKEASTEVQLGVTKITIRDTETSEIREVTLSEVLEEINSDRSAEWTDYNETDWEEGMNEWTNWRQV